MFYEPKGCYMCRMMRVVIIYLCKPPHVNTALHVYYRYTQQSIQSCTPLVNKQFAPGFI